LWGEAGTGFTMCAHQQLGSSWQAVCQKRFQGAGGQLNQKSVLGKRLSLLLVLHMLKQEEMLLYGTIHECIFLLAQAMLGGSGEHGAKRTWTLPLFFCEVCVTKS